MAEENIQIIVHDDGRIEFSTHDIKGEACMEELEKILGELVDDIDKAKTTSEYHEPPSQRKTNISAKKQQKTGSGSS
jgi:hypothetical protein|tara:strand:+ start:272 stop:502 length:231 start_codon:yes stop_codon:yes gene_type:complete